MSGDADELYVAARSVLLDALEALESQQDALILVGAQAIYLHTGSIDLAIAEHTTDADITIDPNLLKKEPKIEKALAAAGFSRGRRVGAWVTTKEVSGAPVSIEIDLMVPEAVGGPGRRAARLAGHAPEVARKARGMEAALIDRHPLVIHALDPRDRRTSTIAVAGPAALLVSKLHKIRERQADGQPRRLDETDALDILRLLRAIPTAVLAVRLLELLKAEVSADVTREAVASLEELFSKARGVGSQMAVRAAGDLATSSEIAESCAALATDLLTAVKKD